MIKKSYDKTFYVCKEHNSIRSTLHNFVVLGRISSISYATCDPSKTALKPNMLPKRCWFMEMNYAEF